MKKLFAIFLVLAMMLTLAACGAVSDSAATNGIYGDAAGLDGIMKDDAMLSPDRDALEEGVLGDVAEDVGDTETDNYPPLTAGTLTAGEWSDLKNQDFWKTLLNRNDWYQLMVDRNLYTNKVVTVYVHDANGNPCYNVPVKLLTSRETVYNARTDVYGYAYISYNLHKTDEVARYVIVNEQSVEVEGDKVDITAENVDMSVEALDLMLMIDTTGSMGDELRYLQKELENVVKRVADAGKTLSIHVSVNFYRDEGDTYVVKEFEFTKDIATALNQLNEQMPDGGGDYPEAVHKALESIVNHQWREDAVKMCFFVLDAPPHSEQEIQGINTMMTNSVKAMAERGIRFIPVASSGVNTETEFLLRSWAVMTGGTYTFLTDHSGVGGEHLEPTIGEYQVEKLNDLMVRLMKQYCNISQQ